MNREDAQHRLAVIEEAERVGVGRRQWWSDTNKPARGYAWLPVEDEFLLLTSAELPRQVQADVLERSYHAVTSRHWLLAARRDATVSRA